MAMTVNDLQRYLDPKKIGSAPVLVKLGVLVIGLDKKGRILGRAFRRKK